MFHVELILLSVVMHDFHALSAAMRSEDVLPAGTRVTLINARNADLKDRENNGRSSSENTGNAFRDGY